MLIFNVLVASMSLWLIMAINHYYLQPALKNRLRFRIYKLRDELSLLAMRGEIDENSDEYVTLIKLINSAIRATGSFKVTDFLMFSVRLYKNEDLRDRIERIKQNLAKTDHFEYCRIARDFFLTMHDILRTDTRVFRHMLFPLFWFIAEALYILKLSSKPRQTVETRNKDVREIGEQFGRYSSQFGEYCAA